MGAAQSQAGHGPQPHSGVQASRTGRVTKQMFGEAEPHVWVLGGGGLEAAPQATLRPSPSGTSQRPRQD